MVEAAIEKQVKFLRHVSLLKGMDNALLAALVSSMKLQRGAKGSFLCKEGGPGNACFIVANGEVEVVVGDAANERILCVLPFTSVVGEVALIDGKKRSASVRCKTEVAYFTLMRDDFERLLAAKSQAALKLLDNIARLLATRVRQANTRYAALFADSAETIATLSTKLTEIKASLESDGGAQVDVDTGGDELLQMLGYKGR